MKTRKGQAQLTKTKAHFKQHINKNLTKQRKHINKHKKRTGTNNKNKTQKKTRQV